MNLISRLRVLAPLEPLQCLLLPRWGPIPIQDMSRLQHDGTRLTCSSGGWEQMRAAGNNEQDVQWVWAVRWAFGCVHHIEYSPLRTLINVKHFYLHPMMVFLFVMAESPTSLFSPRDNSNVSTFPSIRPQSLDPVDPLFRQVWEWDPRPRQMQRARPVSCQRHRRQRCRNTHPGHSAMQWDRMRWGDN